MEQPIIVSIEANIGAGKSTILKKLDEILNPKYSTCVQEPVDYWENFCDSITNRSLIELYYTNPTKYAFPLQTMIYSSLLHELNQTIEKTRTSLYRPLIITERSLQSSSGIFTKMLYDNNIMSYIEYQVYTNCIAIQPIPLDVCIYLRTEPEICYERVHHRNRQGEQCISLDYLRTCHDAHEKWITELNDNTHLYIINVGTKMPEKIVDEILEILSNLSHI